MYTNKIKFVFVMLGLLLVLPSVGWTKGDHGKHKWQDQYEDLNLTDEQMQKVTAIYDESRESHKSIREKIKPLTDELNKMLQSGDSDDDIRKKYAELQGLKTQMSDQKVDKVLKIRDLLDDGQKAKYVGFKSRRHHRGSKPGGPKSQ